MRDSVVLSVRASLWAGSPGLASTMMDLALSALTLARSAVSRGLPDLRAWGSQGWWLLLVAGRQLADWQAWAKLRCSQRCAVALRCQLSCCSGYQEHALLQCGT